MNDKKTVIWKGGLEELLKQSSEDAPSPSEAATTVWKPKRHPSVPTLPGLPSPLSAAAPNPDPDPVDEPMVASDATRPQLLLTDSGEPALPASDFTQMRIYSTQTDAGGQQTRVLPSSRAPSAPEESAPAKAAVSQAPRTSPSVPTGTAPSAASLEARRRVKLRIAIGVMALVIAFLSLVPKRERSTSTQPQPTKTTQAHAPSAPAAADDYAYDDAMQDPSEELGAGASEASAEAVQQAAAAQAALERAAVDALASGDRAAALRHYDRLARMHPRPAPFALAASILRARVEQSDAPR